MIYFDNAATSYPKPFGVYFKTAAASKFSSFNSGRGGYYSAVKAGKRIYAVREKAAALFSAQSENIVFTKNCTEALNTAIRGSIKEGGHIIISSLEHNSVSRVAEHLSDLAIADYSIADFSFDKDKTVGNFKRCIKRNTQLAVITFSSNVFGVMLPIKEIGAVCNEKGIRFIADCAQGAGTYPVSLNGINADIICAPGHKGLMGPMGTGIMALKSGTEINPLLYGGTGVNSVSLKQNKELPESFEAGTLNNSGIIGLGAGIDSVLSEGIENIYDYEMNLTEYIYEELSRIHEAVLYTPKPEKHSFLPVVSFNVKDYSSEKTAFLLAEKGICTRAGLHCAPLAHKAFNTLERGTVRISPGRYNSFKECERFINVVKML